MSPHEDLPSTPEPFPNERCRVLLVEDDPANARMVAEQLARSDLYVGVANGLAGIKTWHATPPDAVLLALNLPDAQVLDNLAQILASLPDVPVFVLSGSRDSALAIEAIKQGAEECFSKDGLSCKEIDRVVRHAIERRRLRQTVAEHDRRLRLLLDRSPAAMWSTDDDLHLKSFTRGALPWPTPEKYVLLGQYLAAVFDNDTASTVVMTHMQARSRSEARCEFELQGRRYECIVRAVGGQADGSTLTALACDITERTLLERQYRQAQKMEAIGRLAGGMAHDLNNILTAIVGCTRFAMETLPDGGPSYADLQGVLKASERAERLTSQLLAFSRQRVVAPRGYNVNHLVTEMQHMLRRILGENIEIVAQYQQDLWDVFIDAGAFEQVWANLAINARDAMPEGGRLLIETRNTRMGEPETIQGITVPGGDYVSISVIDTGHGIPEDIRKMVFEPFFTTKPAGRGSGLGLSTCYGIIKQADGFIWIDSQPVQGTRVEILLPRLLKARKPSPARRSGERSRIGHETILVVEDDEQIRTLIHRSLTRNGFRVLTAPNGFEALQICKQPDIIIDLLLTDVVMPLMTGRDLATAVSALFPNMAVIFMSGYPCDIVANHGVLLEGTTLLDKPFTPESLVQTVRRTLDDDSR